MIDGHDQALTTPAKNYRKGFSALVLRTVAKPQNSKNTASPKGLQQTSQGTP